MTADTAAGTARPRVIDAFLYNGEPIVELRLRLLDPVVDEFLVVESKHTFSGAEKPAWYVDVNAGVFAPYRHKTRIVRVEQTPPPPPGFNPPVHNPRDWWREHYQRNSIADAVDDAVGGSAIDNTPFVLVCTDADEIPNPSVLADPAGLHRHIGDEPVYLEMALFMYNFDWIRRGETWTLGFVVNDACYRSDTLNALRCDAPKRRTLRDAGWHCGYFFSTDDIARKLESFSHQELNQARFKDREHVRACIAAGRDLFLRSGQDLDRRDGHDGTGLPPGWRDVQAALLAVQ